MGEAHSPDSVVAIHYKVLVYAVSQRHNTGRAVVTLGNKGCAIPGTVAEFAKPTVSESTGIKCAGILKNIYLSAHLKGPWSPVLRAIAIVYVCHQSTQPNVYEYIAFGQASMLDRLCTYSLTMFAMRFLYTVLPPRNPSLSQYAKCQ